MSTSETSSDGLWNDLVIVLNQFIHLGKTIGQTVLGIGLFLLAAWVYMNPVLDEKGWLFGIGFYELLLLAFGSVFFLMAYRNIQATEVI